MHLHKIYERGTRNVGVQILKCICANPKMYLFVYNVLHQTRMSRMFSLMRPFLQLLPEHILIRQNIFEWHYWNQLSSLVELNSVKSISGICICIWTEKINWTYRLWSWIESKETVDQWQVLGWWRQLIWFLSINLYLCLYLQFIIGSCWSGEES